MPLTAPWHNGKTSLNNAQSSEDGAETWAGEKLEETNIVVVTGAIIAAVASAALSWESTATWPWPATATVYSSLILSLVSVYTGCQQHIAILRYGKNNNGKQRMHRFLKNHSLQGIVWSVPQMLLNISILLMVVAILIIIWDQAVKEPAFGRGAKIALVSSVAGIFGMLCMLISMIQGVYRLPREQFGDPNNGLGG